MPEGRNKRQLHRIAAVIALLLLLLFNVNAHQPLSAAQATSTASVSLSRSKKIAYAVMSTDEAGVQIYTMNTDGSNVQRLTNADYWSQSPSWSPDGKQIAFASDRVDQIYQIYVMNADGSGQTPLTHNPAGAIDPAWSPDGKYIAYDAPLGDYETIFIMNADGTNAHPLLMSKTFNSQFPTWSPDSKQIAFSGFGDIDHNGVMAINRDGSALHLIYRAAYTGFDCSTSPCAALVTKVSWSPQGKQIAFASDLETGVVDLFAVNSDGSAKRRLIDSTKEPSTDFDRQDPAWSPDGKHIVFDMNIDYAATDIFILDIETGVLHRLTESHYKAFSFNPAWQP